MKKINNHQIWNYFNSINKGLECKICKRKYKNPLLNTLKKHFITKHNNIWLEIRETKVISARGNLIKFLL